MAGPFADEAAFFYVSALRGAGKRADYERDARVFADSHRESPYAQDALNNLASYFIVEDEDEHADEVFRLLIHCYPAGRFTERAYWRVGWWAYRDGRFQEAATLFDCGAAQFQRSDYRPSRPNWSGRAWLQVGQPAQADDRFALALTDYYNSYYGRLARRHLSAGMVPAITAAIHAHARDDALGIPYRDAGCRADRSRPPPRGAGTNCSMPSASGDSPQLTATLALVHNRMGNLRLGINAMKRAYPQWMAAGGESLPVEIQRVVFPIDYWPLIQKHAAAHGLDPFLVAALVAQESTFDPAIRLSANAVGLMQVLPSTGRQFARKLKIPRYTPARLTDPERTCGSARPFLPRASRSSAASTSRWPPTTPATTASRRGGASGHPTWIRTCSSTPFPETQNYVKRILGTAEDDPRQ